MKMGQATIVTTGLAMLGLGIGTLTCAHASYIDLGSAGYFFQLAIAGAFGLLYSWRNFLQRRQRPSAPPANPRTTVRMKRG